MLNAKDSTMDDRTIRYAFITDTNTCDETVTLIDRYTDNTVFTVSDESHNGMYLCAKAEDMAGNMVFAKDTAPVNVDTTAPMIGSVEVLSDFDPYVNGIAFLIRAEVSDSHSGIDWTSCAVTTDFNSGDPESSSWTPGMYMFGRCISGSIMETDGDILEINVKVSDNVGNTSYGTAITRTADSQDPTFNTFDITPLSGIYTSGSPTLSSTVEDTVSPITECQARYKRVLWSGWINGTLTPSGLTATCVVNLSGLTHNAVYDFQMRVKDSAGHWENSAPMNNLRIDAQMPSADASGFTSDPAINTPSNDNTVWVSWTNAGIDTKSGLDGYSFDFTNAPATPDQIKDLEETDFAATSAPLADGTWWFNMSTVDNVGNWTSTAHYGPFMIDTTAPVFIEITSGLSDGTYGPMASVGVTAQFNEALRSDSVVVVTLDNGVIVTLDQVYGDYVFGMYDVGATGSGEDSSDLTVASLDSVSVYDIAGNLYSSTAIPAGENLGDNKDLVIDVTAPSIPVNGTPHNIYLNTNVFDFEWDDSTDVSPVHYIFQSSLNPAETGGVLTTSLWTSGLLPTSMILSTGAPDGKWYWQVIAQDSVGNMSDWSEIWNVTLDTVAPDTTITNPSDMDHISGTVDFRGTIEDENLWRYYYRIYNQGGTTITSATVYRDTPLNDETVYSWDTTGVADGIYLMRLEARDKANNKDAGSTDEIEVYVDNTGPVGTQLENMSFLEGDLIPDINLEATDPSGIDQLCLTVTSAPSAELEGFIGCFDPVSETDTTAAWNLKTIANDNGFNYFDTSVWHEGYYDFEYYFTDKLGNVSDSEMNEENSNYYVWMYLENVIPEVDLEMDQTITEGEEASFTGWFSDPSCIEGGSESDEMVESTFMFVYETVSDCSNKQTPDDSDWVVVVDYGDGSSTTFAQSTPGEISVPSHVYTHEGEYEVTLMVCESEGSDSDYVELMALQVYDEEIQDWCKPVKCAIEDDEPNFALMEEDYVEDDFFATGYGEGMCGCDAVTVTVTNNAPTVVIETDPGDSTTLLAITMDTVITEGNSPFTYEWSNGNFAGCTGTASSVTTPATPGSYTCEVLVTDFDGDTATAIKTVVVNPVIPTDLLPTVVLFGNAPATNNSGTVNVAASANFTITANLNNLGNPNYNFTFGGICAGSIVNTANSTFVSNVMNLLPGNYICTVSASDSDSDLALASVPVVVGSVLGIGDAAPQTPNQGEEEDDTDENILGSDTQVCEERFTLSGAVFDDINKNGTQEEGEKGTAGVLVQVYYLFNFDEVIVAEETTSADGSYEFEICPGNYNIRIDKNDIPENYTVLGQSDKSVEVTDDSVENFNFVLGLQEMQGNAFNWWILLLIIIVIGGGTGVYLYAGRKEE